MTPSRSASITGLEHDEVQLWWRSLADEELVRSARAWLSAEEVRQSERFQRAEDARAFVARRGFLRARLGEYLERAPGELEFRAGRNGKPALVAPASDIEFSLSRAGDWCLLGCARARAVGVDVERIDPRLTDELELMRLGERVLTPDEREELVHLPRSLRASAFVRAWARKEALLKALGTGLTREPNMIAVGTDELGPLATRELAPEFFPRAQGALLFDLIAPKGFMASVVAEGRDWNLVLCSRPVA